MAKSYEALMGALGRSVFYRPERQRVRELLSRDARPKLLVNGDEFPIFDISMNGISFLSHTDGGSWPIGDELDLSLLLHGESVYSGSARIARVEPGPRGARVGLGLTTGFLDLPDILRRDDQKRLERDLREGPTTISRMVPEAYREAVNEIAFFIQFYRRSLCERENHFRSGGSWEAASQELAERAYDAIRDRWWKLQLSAAKAGLACLADREILLAAKDYTEAMVTPLLLSAPFVQRSYEKPLGYPGDYHVMNWCYANTYEGDSTFGRAMHKFYVDHYPLSVGVRTRKDFMVDLMGQEHQRVTSCGQRPDVFRVVSLGCGPAREVSDYIAKNQGWPGGVVWTLIDQEEEALSVAYQASRREIGKSGCRGHLNLLNLSFVQLLSEGLPLQEPESQNFIYSVGMFDYLRESRAQTLLGALYHLLKTGGLMAIGNAVAPNDFFWAAEFLADWTLLYRTREEMYSLANLLPEGAEKEVVLEPSGSYYYLLVRKH